MTGEHGYLVWTKRDTGEVVRVAELGPKQQVDRPLVLPPIEGTVVGGHHPLTLDGSCLSCGRPDYAPGCEGEGAVEPEGFTFGPPD